jgi:uncharacterized membrane protein
VSYYEVLLLLHIFAVVVWVGGGIMLLLLTVWGEQTRNAAFMQGLGASSEWLAQRLFIPSSLATLVFGVLLTIEGPWTFDILWVDLGFVGFAVSFLTGLLFLRPEGDRIGRAIAAHGPESSEARHHLHRIGIVHKVEFVILVLVVAAMTIKPTSEDAGTLILFAVVAAAAAAFGAWNLRAGPAVQTAG